MFGATCSVINKISNEGANYSQRGDAEAAYMILTSFEFILMLHLMKEIMRLKNMLRQTLQQKSLDILNVMSQVSTTQLLIQKMRDDGWEPLLATVKSFCEENDIDIHDMNAHYTRVRGRSRRQDEGSPTIMEHHFRVDIFTAAIDFQLQELKNRFSEQAVELLTLSVALSPKDAYKSFKIDDILLTLPVSTATTERAFSAMKLIKTRLRTRMQDEFLADHLVVYIEKEIAKNFTSEIIMDEFYPISDCRRA
ncbi:uncharacterized protein LOC132162215 [Corylus avellana]|uniref:uncharacterized protein LOC132162215 n=1 Tax=Corylus avellana TaxID=13451 RepID=UPI00286C8250|nr:uncharacterized protein LOC132162215 [Corylus avellana]